MSDRRVIRQALISVSDKTGVVAFARALQASGVHLLSTGGTAKLLQGEGIPVTEVSAHTGFPEMLDGRVKTLHPKIHGGLLARRDLPAHQQAIAQADITPIDLLVVNLYPFAQTIAQADCSFEQAIEQIDIGGPAMLRSGAKNHADVTVVVDPSDYAQILNEHHAGGVGANTRFTLARKVFAHTAAYDGAIANYLGTLDETHQPSTLYPQKLSVQFTKLQDLRYGENPHQSAAFYRDADAPSGSLATAQQIQGKELSYNNIADADAAWECVKSFVECACVIVKHANPCGVAIAESPSQAYAKAFATDPTSAFGGILAFNRPIDANTALAISQQFAEVIIAPAIDDAARTVFAKKSNLRVLLVPPGKSPLGFDMKRVGGGVLIQSADQHELDTNTLQVVSARAPTAAEQHDLLFAWRVAKFVKSNAIVFCRDGMTLGVGAGQMSRIDSARIATIKAEHAKLSLQGACVASDAFFPFRDGLDTLVAAGASAVIQPGGSMRDDEVIAAANEHGIAMLFTHVRHFRH